MKTRIFSILLAVILLGSGTVNAVNIVIDFDILGAGGDDGPTYMGSSSYSEDGFTLTTTSEFGFVRRNDTDSIALFSRYGNDILTLIKDDEGMFDLLSIDFYPYVPMREPIEFIATLNDNSTISQTFPAYEGYGTTVVFDNFSDIVSVSWQVTDGHEYFDNITIIPEPASLCLLAFGSMTILRKNII